MKCVDSNSRYEPPIKDPAIQGSNPLSHPEPIRRERKREREKGGGGGATDRFPHGLFGTHSDVKAPSAALTEADAVPNVQRNGHHAARRQIINRNKLFNLIQKPVIQLETETETS